MSNTNKPVSIPSVTLAMGKEGTDPYGAGL